MFREMDDVRAFGPFRGSYPGTRWMIMEVGLVLILLIMRVDGLATPLALFVTGLSGQGPDSYQPDPEPVGRRAGIREQ